MRGKDAKTAFRGIQKQTLVQYKESANKILHLQTCLTTRSSAPENGTELLASFFIDQNADDLLKGHAVRSLNEDSVAWPYQLRQLCQQGRFIGKV